MISRIAFAVVLPLLVSCAGTESSPAGNNRMIAIYSPPVRLGGTGQVTFLPAPGGAEQASLETPDRTPQPPTADWLAGTWLHDATTDDLARWACSSGTVFTYRRNGTYFFLGEDGVWRLEGDEVTIMPTQTSDDIIPPEEASIGVPFSTRIKRVGSDEGAMLSDTGWQPMLRCRPGDLAKPAD